MAPTRDRSFALLLGLATATLHVFAAAPLVRALELDGAGACAACAVYFVVIGFLLHALESRFYFEERVVTGRHLVGGVLAFSAIAGLTSLLASGGENAVSLAVALEDWWQAPGRSLLRIAYPAVVFMVVYCVIGSATWPFVRPYYERPDSGLALRVPNGRVVIVLQLGRGVIATAALIPLMAGLGSKAEDIRTWGYLAATLAATYAIAPMVMAPKTWPTRLRVIHGIEILVFVGLQSCAWWWFLGR